MVRWSESDAASAQDIRELSRKVSGVGDRLILMTKTGSALLTFGALDGNKPH